VIDEIDKERCRELCDLIASDMENDMDGFDGKPFTGLTVGTQFGNQAAAIASLAKLVRDLI
jgi:hypothetical protein